MNHLKHKGIINHLENKEVVIPYNKNMARNNYSTGESLKNTNQREKNNLANRKSRMINQLMAEALQEEADHVIKENQKLKTNVARNRVYVNLLCKQLGYNKLDLSYEWENEEKTLEKKPENFSLKTHYKQEVERKMPKLIPMLSSSAREMISLKRKITRKLFTFLL